jgi:hypothetical protein
MNELIKELAKQACRAEDFGPEWWQSSFKDKFAQLIVKECLTQVDKMRDVFEADGKDEQAVGAEWVGLAIAKHFGVEL